MKYIITPIVQFIWAILLTAWVSFWYAAECFMSLIWMGNIPKDVFETETDYHTVISPYYKRNSNIFGKKTWKTAYHWIWNIT